MKTKNTPSIQYTNKLFYGEYAYSCVVNFYEYHLMQGRHAPTSRYAMLQLLSFDTWEEALENYGWSVSSRNEVYFKKVWNRKEDYVEFLKWLEDNESHMGSWETMVKIRTEGSKLSLYFRTEELINDFLKQFESHVISVSRPISETRADYIRNNPKDMIVKKYPYKNFRYKLIWQDKYKLKEDKKQAFLKWCEGFAEDSMKITPQLKDFLNKKTHWWGNSAYGAYMYVRDDFALSMINLYLSETNIFKVRKYVLEKDIEKIE